MDAAELDHRFAYHPPPNETIGELHASVRGICRDVAAGLNHLLPDGSEKALAITNLEQVMFWANAAIARTAAVSPAAGAP